jgi:periplasmic divalent cation tolerance protein
MAEEILLAISTFPDAATAARVSEELVTQNLAACANIGAPVRSIYHWQGKLEKSDETLVFFKTTRSRFDDFQTTLKSLHPYEVPEIVCVSVAGGLPEYLQWVRESCSPESPETG